MRYPGEVGQPVCSYKVSRYRDHVYMRGGVTRLGGMRFNSILSCKRSMWGNPLSWCEVNEFPEANITVTKPAFIPNKMVSRCYQPG